LPKPYEIPSQRTPQSAPFHHQPAVRCRIDHCGLGRIYCSPTNRLDDTENPTYWEILLEEALLDEEDLVFARFLVPVEVTGLPI